MSPSSELNKKNNIFLDQQHGQMQARTLGEKMVDFIRRILGEENRPIDEKLIRDDD